jgi:hypothetical protein
MAKLPRTGRFRKILHQRSAHNNRLLFAPYGGRLPRRPGFASLVLHTASLTTSRVKPAEVVGGRNREVLAWYIDNRQRREKLFGGLVIPVMTEALENLGQDHVADGDGFDLEQFVEPSRGGGRDSVEIVVPHTRIDDDHQSFRISSRSPCHESFPRYLLSRACFSSRINALRPSSTASRLVFAPVRRKTSAIRSSSITMLVRIFVV